MSTDTQVIEAIGQGHVIAQFLREGFEVARPVRDNGIDLVVYRTVSTCGTFEAHPVQIKVATNRRFGIWKKYGATPNLWLVFAWEIEGEPQLFRLTHAQAVEIGKEFGWTDTDSWKKRGEYQTTRPSEELIRRLAEHAW